VISFPFVLACLVISCAVVSVVYSLTSPGDADRIVKESIQSFGMMFGGIVALAVAIVAIPWARDHASPPVIGAVVVVAIAAAFFIGPKVFRK
jgi:drug/metabolite transporter (DMT)-like permease